LKRLLDKLETQTYPAHLLQVIVVADGCKDATVRMLQNHKASYELKYLDLPGEGAAVARNKGAALATGELLLFIDDDIDPSGNLVEAHVKAHQNENTVVIGYLPFAVAAKPGFFTVNLWAWWEKKFQQMRNPAYRYSYEDLLSGNFSLSTNLFRQMHGFDSELRCREDYELGIRLIQSDAAFVFCKEAWGYHRDEITDLHRSLKRKREEGKADVQFWRKHPDLTTSIQDAYSKNEYSFLGPKTIFFVIHFTMLTEAAAVLLEKLMYVLESLRLRKKWHAVNYKLHMYWYLRGLLDELPSRKKLKAYLKHTSVKQLCKEELEIDLKDGLEAAEEQLDRFRPGSVKLLFEKQAIGSIPLKPGTERLRGVHLRHLLATQFSNPLLKTIALEQLINQPAEA
ncbi:MAG TPA: glycosyltransferase, partial [Flavisolibacter sp.]|nr:glycosyltransferase [Flavisolibacter sp.]